MRYILILLVFLSCTKEELKKPYCKPNFKMNISDSIPVQFWVNGQETFNQKTIYGLAKQDCFCQPWQCDDQIKIQFEDDEYENYYLSIQDADGNQLEAIAFTALNSPASIWEADFDLADYCDQQINLNIYANTFEELENNSFVSTLSPWTSEGSGDAWSSSLIQFTNTAYLNLQWSEPMTSYTSKYLTQLFNTYTGYSYSLAISGKVALAQSDIQSYTGSLVVYFSNGSTRDAAMTIDLTDYNLEADTELDFSQSGSFTALNNYDRVEIVLQMSDVDAGAGGEIYFIVNEITLTTTGNKLAYSDCLDIKTSHLTSVLIEYTNSRDFDGILYETGGSPYPSFSLRIPAMFHQEDNPQTQEDSELSNGEIVTRRQTIQEKTLLETGYMPNYMHKKLQKVLMHNSITINGEMWKRRDPYNTDPIRKYNLKMANVLLTKYDSVNRNTI